MIQFLMHDKHDTVGVAVVDVKGGQSLEGRSLDTNETVKAKANMDIPLGHKFALKDLKPGKYALLCFISDRQGGPPHIAKGMITEATVR